MTCKNEAADRVVLPNAGGPVVLQVAVPARTQKPVTQNLAGRGNSRAQHRQAGVGRLHQLGTRQGVVLLLGKLTQKLLEVLGMRSGCQGGR
jgi:hypothetical protein